jgi:hypothetical protein
MVKFCAHFDLWVAAAMFAAGATLCPAQTPPAANPPAFSQPADSETAAPESHGNLPADDSSQPSAQFFSLSPPASLGSPTPDFNPAWQKQQQARAEWSLQTPEEIMGLQTPRQMFGLPEADQDLSPEERYLHRQNLAKAAAAEARLSPPDGLNHDFSVRLDRTDGVDSPLSPVDRDAAASFSRMFKDAGPSPFGSSKSPLSGSEPAAATSAAEIAKAQQAQAAEMARFRNLIGEAPLSRDPAPILPHPPLASGLQPADALGVDEFGRPAAPHPVDPSKPSGLTLPPEIIGYHPETPRKAKKPAWEPQVPPWLSGDLSTPDKPPLRKFY